MGPVQSLWMARGRLLLSRSSLLLLTVLSPSILNGQRRAKVLCELDDDNDQVEQ